jgi:DNA polymerase-3 subunit alpha
MQYIPGYARRKNGQEQVTFLDERLKPITASTHGICIYQEQSMEIAKNIAGFSPAEADDLRKAIGKKNHKLMASLKEKFIAGTQANGVSAQVARQLWEDMEKAKDYSFNKSHAACYALIAYRTAWLKAHYPHQYMAALISSVMNTKDRVPFYVNACDEMGIEVLPPDVNFSQPDFAVVEGKIRFGLNAVKGVGEGAARGIVATRSEGGTFTSLWDFVERIDSGAVNKRVLEALVKCGAFDSTGASRRGALEMLDQIVAWGQKRSADKIAGQGSIFDLATGGDDGGGVQTTQPRHHPELPGEEFDRPELLKLEKEVLGLYVSEHPLHAIRDQLKRKTDCTLADIDRRRDGEIVVVGGIVGRVRQLTTKKGEPMAFMRLDDVSGGSEVVVFSSVYAQARELCVCDQILIVKGRIDHKEGESKLLALDISAFEAVPERREVRLRVDARKARAGIVAELAALVKEYPGDSPVLLDVETSEGARQLRLGSSFQVKASGDFFAEVKALLGEAGVVVA